MKPAFGPNRRVPTQQSASTDEQGAQHRHQPVVPDRRIGAQAGQLHGRRLQPVDADGLLVARDLLQADIDIVAGFDHLLRSLHVAALVAVERRDAGNSGHGSATG